MTLENRVDELEEHILGQDPAKPGIMLRQDRQERQLSMLLAVVKYMVFGGGAVTLWKIGEVLISLRIRIPTPP